MLVAPLIFVPFFNHWYVCPVPEFAVSVTLPPLQNVVGPPAVIEAVTVVVAGIVEYLNQ
jgi:hypothetical protein